MFSEFVEITSCKVCAAYASLKEYITTEQATVFFAIINHAAWRVAGYVDGFKNGMSKLNLVTIANVLTEWGGGFVHLKPEHATLCVCLI